MITRKGEKLAKTFGIKNIEGKEIASRICRHAVTYRRLHRELEEGPVQVNIPDPKAPPFYLDPTISTSYENEEEVKRSFSIKREGRLERYEELITELWFSLEDKRHLKPSKKKKCGHEIGFNLTGDGTITLEHRCRVITLP